MFNKPPQTGQYSQLCLLVILLLFLLTTSASAQVVNIETKRKDERVAGISGVSRMNFMYRAGNVKRVDFGFDSLVQAVRGRHIFLGMAGLEFAKARGRNQSAFKLVENERFFHLRYHYTLRDWLLSDLFYQLQVNEFIDLDSRNLIGVGPRFRLVRTDKNALYLGTTWMYEREHLRPPHPGGTTTTARWSNYLSIRWGSIKNIDFTSTTYFQPRFAEMGDFRVLEEAGLAVDLTGWLALSIRYTLRYDSTPPAGISKSDQRITQGLTFKY
jgi:putative salt-induced outer membrane protein YdiY